MEFEMMPKMLDFILKTYYPELITESKKSETVWLDMYKEIVRRTARLVALWQSVGFCHGVLNTDNMSILGLTIDYGPFGFMDYFNFDHICISSDGSGRYSYKNQPEICKWNLEKLAEALKPCVDYEEMMVFLEETYQQVFEQVYYERLRQKV